MSTQNPVVSAPEAGATRWLYSPLGWLVIALACIATAVPFLTVLNGLIDSWSLNPANSHGLAIPFVALFLIWRQRAAIIRAPADGSWIGLLVIAAGLVLGYIEELSTIWVIGQYAFLVVLAGLILALIGRPAFRTIWKPLVILIFMIPLPAFFNNSLSLNLQLLSSAIGVAIIRLFGISVFLDGNVIDLGSFKLQVVEACDGLRYLFPLMTLAFMLTYFFRAPFWSRALLVLSSIPVAIFMNSARIGLIGVTVEYWGARMAEGVLHDFEGWVVFMLSLVVLLGIAALLSRLGPGHLSLRDALILDLGEPAGPPAPARALSTPFLVAAGLVVVASLLSTALPERVEVTPSRRAFFEFPLRLGEWQGTRNVLEKVYLDELKVDDYELADYHRPGAAGVNVWIPWYASQRKGQSTHSPRSCLPGGGWEIERLDHSTVALADGRSFMVNRALITQADQRQLVYYWFQQRGRVITDEYLVKWYLFYDAVTRSRTDGALVRLIVNVPKGTRTEDAERTLGEFAGNLAAALPAYIPD